MPRQCDEHGSACAFKALCVELQEALLHVDEPAVVRSIRGLGSVAEATFAPPPSTPTHGRVSTSASIASRPPVPVPHPTPSAQRESSSSRLIGQLGMGEEAGVGPGPRSQAAPRSPAAVREGSTALHPGAANHSLRAALQVAEEARASVAESREEYRRQLQQLSHAYETVMTDKKRLQAEVLLVARARAAHQPPRRGWLQELVSVF